MANAIVILQAAQPNDGQLQLVCDVVYVGDDIVGGPQQGSVVADIAGDATIATIRSQLSAAIQADATARGITVPASRVTLPAFQKG